MEDQFYNYLFNKPNGKISIPSNEIISEWAKKVVHFLFPESSGKLFSSQFELKEYASKLEQELYEIISKSCPLQHTDCKETSRRFFSQLPELYQILNTDITAIFEGDPAAVSKFEVVRSYPGFYAICFYRIAHVLYSLGVPIIPRILTEHAHSRTGVDIHPAATIGAYFYIDHGTGIVIGETAIIGEYVKLYQGVTLGALSVRKVLAGIKRHPTVEDRVVIYSGATILGGETVIGHDSIIGGNVWLTESIEPYSTAYHSPIINIRNTKQTS
ncbi:serine acetyltransferase [Pedobacter yonginense]|uniref:Serine acetyltransferase n=1 Tax=Pedobacter yonginense TaxID=651869 RepID=A0A317EU40_9SPHI|nr:serine O-acetyltransferase EpsC [Pedobacter yonginense]PWS29547.1 serine acetyltransferase [Pedobacter yonginense]